MQLTKGAIGNLINRYKAVLKKCHLMNTFGSLAVAGMLIMGGAGMAVAADAITTGQDFQNAVTNATGDTITLGQDIKEGVGAVFTGKTVTVDFGGHTYTGYSNSVGSSGTETQLFQLLKDSPAVTLKNGILNIATSPAESGKFKMVLQNYCDLTLDNMVVDGTNLLGDVNGTYTMSNNHGDITINNSTIIAKKGEVAFDVYYTPSYDDGVSVTVNNSTINGKIEVTVASGLKVDAKKHQLTLTGGTLTGGLTAAQGAQLYNEGRTVISDVAMAGNTATDKGGAIFNSDDKTGAKGDLTLNNVDLKGNNVDLKGNNANFGGAIWNEGMLTVNRGSFEGNTAKSAAGAIYNAAEATLTVDGVTFASNSSAKAGAINSMAGKNNSTTTIKNSKFNNNSAVNGMGGALANSSNNDKENPNQVFSGEMTLTDTTFSGNTARNGGALWNGAQWTVDITGGSFDNNSAVTPAGSTYPAQGGAISNSGALNISGVTFSNNKTDGLGGAIYNTKTGGGAGSITFNGTNTFTNNTAAGKANDIYNAGTITVAGGTTTLNSGLVLAADSITTVAGGALVVNGSTEWADKSATMTLNNGTLTLQKNDVLNGYDKLADQIAHNASQLTLTSGTLYLITTEDYTLDDLQKAKETLGIADGGMFLGFQGGKLVDGQNSGNLTVETTTGGKVIGTSNITIGDAPVSTGGNTVLVGNDLTIKAGSNSAVTITGNADVKVNTVDIETSAGGAASVTIAGVSGTTGSLTVVGNGAGDKLLTSNGELANIAVSDGGTFTMGIEGNSQAQGGQVGTVTVTDGGTLTSQGNAADTSQYAINALTMNANSQVNVLDSIMQIGEFQANGGTMFVDPAYVKIDSASTFGTQLLVGSGSTVDIGGMPEADMRQAMEEAGMSVGPNFTVGANQSVLVLGQGITLGATSGQIVVDAAVNIDGTIGSPSMTVTNTVHFGDDSLLVVDAGKLDGHAAIDGSAMTGRTAFIADGAKLQIVNATKGDVTILKGFTGTSGTTSGINIGTGWGNTTSVANPDRMLSSTLKVDDPAGSVTVTSGVNRASDVLPGLDSDLDPVMASVWDNSLNDVDSADMGVRFLSRAANSGYIADAGKAAATIESAARIAFAGAVPQMTKMASDAATNAVVNRLGFANPADGAQAMDAEGKIVDRNTTGFALWIAPLWQNQHGWGMEAGNMDYGFNGNLGGVSLGADYTFENAIRAGITFNIGGGYAESSGGDLSSTDNRMNFWGLGAYAGWNYENFGVMADVSYTSTWNQLKQDLDSRLGMGNELEADVQATAISAGLRAEYKLETSVLDIIPHIGVRYMSLNTWGYDVEANGGNVLEGDGFHQDIWTFPVGVTFTKDFTLDSGWSFKPSIDFSVIPAAGDIKAKQDVRFTGAPVGAELETQMMDYLTWQGGVGLELANDNMSIGVNYTLQAGQHTTGHGVFGSFRYEF